MGLRIGSFLGGVARAATGLLPGPVGVIARGAVSAVTSAISGRAGSALVPSFNPPAVLQSAGAPRLGAGGGGAVVPYQGRVSPMGTVGMCPTELVYTKSGQVRRYRLKKGGGCTWHKRPTMNPGNARAAGHAITRIKAARRLLQRIESALPKRKATSSGRKKSCGCK